MIKLVDKPNRRKRVRSDIETKVSSLTQRVGIRVVDIGIILVFMFYTKG